MLAMKRGVSTRCPDIGAVVMRVAMAVDTTRERSSYAIRAIAIRAK